MPTWKRIVLDGEQQNIGENNLTVSDSSRILTLDGNTFTINHSSAVPQLNYVKIDNLGGGCFFGGSTSGGNAAAKTTILGDSGTQTLTIDSSGSTLVTDKFVVQNDNDGQFIHPNITLYKNSSSPADSDYLGGIRFKGNSIDGDNSAVIIPDEEYAKIYAQQLDVSDDSRDSKLYFQVQQAGSQREFTFQAEPSNASEIFTPRENILRSISAHGSANTLELLTRRNKVFLQYGYNAGISATNTATYQFMRGVNGVDHSNDLGFLIPYSGWITGMTLVGERTLGSDTYGVGIRVFNIDENHLVWDSGLSNQTSGTNIFKLRFTSNYLKSTDQVAHYVPGNSRINVQVYVKNNVPGSITIDKLIGSLEFYYEDAALT